MFKESRPSEIVAAINHELRTPLNAILGFSDLLADAEGLDLRQRRYVENIRTSGHRLLCLVEDIVGMARRARESELGRVGLDQDAVREEGGVA